MKELNRKNIEDIAALTSIQEGMLFRYLKDPGSDAYFEQLGLRINGRIDIKIFKQAWNVVIRTNQMLRTVFRWERVGNPIQIVLKEHQFQPKYYDFSGKEVNEAARALEEIKVKDRRKKFDLREVPFRVILCKIQESKYEMIVSNHHILYDGWSNGIILKEFFEAYEALICREHVFLFREHPKTKFKEFIKWNQNRDIEKEEKFWRSYFQGIDTQIGLSVKRSKKRKITGTGNHQVRFKREEKDRVEDFVKRHQLTLASLFYSAWGLLLQKYNSSDDVIFGTTVSGRTAKINGIEDIVGLFINTLPLRIQTTPGETIKDLLHRMDNVLRVREEFENSSLVDIRKYSDIDIKGELFDSIVILENYPLKLSLNNCFIEEKGGLSLAVESYSMVEETHYDLTVRITVFEELEVSLLYNKEMFDDECIINMSRHFMKIIRQMVTTPIGKISDIEIITREEKNRVLYDFNNTGTGYPREKTIYEGFKEQVERTPDNIALVGPQMKYRTHMTYISYRELNEKNHRLACLLHEKGVGLDTIVAIMVERSVEMIIGILGILKAGGAYLPIDTDYPQERIDYMLKDSGAKILLTGQEIAGLYLPQASLNLSEGRPFNSHHSSFIIHHSCYLAYIIYTSGSTGKPKGVMIEHYPVINRLNWMQAAYPIRAGDVILQKTPIVFDVSVWELFWWGFQGACLCFLKPGEEKDPGAIGEVIETFGVTTIHFVPSMLNAFLDYWEGFPSGVGTSGHQSLLKSLRQVFCSGEALGAVQVERFYALFKRWDCPKLINLYGPTEATVDVSYFNCPRGKELEKVPIGKPIHNLQLYVLDNGLRLQPIGVTGELAISGIGLARGYLNNPELTAEKFLFVSNRSYRSYKSYISKKIYKTGDLARWLHDGNIEFLGRIDQQVKLRGFRIELGEIENHLLVIEEIKEAVVLAREGKPGDQYLCAYIVSEEEFDRSILRDHLSGRLPDYMIPSYFVQLEEMPLTPNGKVDRKALPGPGTSVGKDYAAPRDETEKKLVEIWSEVLGIDVPGYSPPGIDDNFFELGGHSLKATILISRLHKEFSVKVPMEELFKSPYIRGLARYILNARGSVYEDIRPVEKKEYYHQSSAQKRLFFLDHFEDIGTSYNMSSVYQIKGKPDKTRYEEGFNALIRRHETLRTSFHLVDSQPVQGVHDEVKFEIDDFLATENTESTGEFVRPFDISKAPLLRLGFVALPGEGHLLLFDMHHIISDGTSLAILVDNFTGFYEGEVLPPMKIQYKDFAVWQDDMFKTGQIKVQEDYWLELYNDAPEIPRLNLPIDTDLDGRRPPVFTFAGDTYGFKLEQEEALRFKALGRGNGATVFMNVLTVMNVLLYKYTGQEDIIIGCSIAGRPHAELQQVIGMFVNELPIRNNPLGEKSYREFLNEVKVSGLRAFENQAVPFEALVDRLNLERDPSRNPLFDVCLSAANFEGFQKKIEHKLIAPFNYENKTSKFDITLFTNDAGDGIDFSMEYCTSLFKRETIRQLAVRFLDIIRQVNTNAEIRLREIDILTRWEKEQLVLDFNQTDVSYPADKTLHELFEEQVKRTPDRIAVVGHGCMDAWMHELVHITYSEFNGKANQLAHYLSGETGIGPEERVGILMNPSFELIITLLGTLKAGGAYVPLEPSLPEERLKTIINDADIGVVISQKNHIRKLNRLQWECKAFRTFFCIDSRDIYGECEEETNELMDEKLWGYIGETASDDITAGGWFTSYTGEPFTREEMEEYGDNILKKLTPILHRQMRVLEIGCASGISMYRLAPLVDFYLGTDLSPVIIEKNKERVEQEKHQNIALACVPAHRIDMLGEKDFDLVILNSVIQSFHGHNYLRQVIGKLVDLMADKGYLFIGDIMDQDLKRDLVQEMIRFKQEHANNAGTFKTKTDWSSELFISRSFLEDLTIDIPEIHEVTFSKKIYTIENELTKFRYDSLLEINKKFLRMLHGSQGGGFYKKSPPGRRRQKHKYQVDLSVLQRYESESGETVVSPVEPVNSAYIIYTSGSTGRPKGVVVEHRGLVNYVWWGMKCYIDDRAKDYVFPLYTPLSFDLTVTSIFLPLISGHRIAVYETGADDEQKRFPILDIIKHDGVDVVKTTPSHLKLLQADISRLEENNRLKGFIVGGEELDRALASDIYEGFSQRVEIYNEYGPTEATVGCMIYTFDHERDTGKGVPIGLPIDNIKIYILDNDLNPVPANAAGEICIAGVGLARGYLNLPELTAEKFLSVSNRSYMSYRSYISKKIYKTGDLACRLGDSNGNIRFLGRKDEQVKIRGYRIELKEIESKLLEHDAIKEAVVISGSRGDETNDNYLCAYIVPGGHRVGAVAGENIPGSSDLREFLSHVLPGYMIPSYFVPIEKVPLTVNGKLDRKSLPVPGIQGTAAAHHQAPKNEIEKKLVEIWWEVLGIEKSNIGIDTNFFELGGHSLKVTLQVSKIHREFEVKIPLAEVFKRQTIRQLAGYIKAAEKNKYAGIEPVEKKEYYALSSAQKRMYFLQQMDFESTSYNMPSFLPLGKDIEKEKLESALKKLIARHESLRTSFVRVNDTPVQRIYDRVEYEIGYYDMKEVEVKVEEERSSLLEGTRGLAPLFIKEFIRPFDLSRAPLLRVGLIETKQDIPLLMVDMHHIISDGTSQTILAEDFMTLYNGEQLKPLKLHYKDFSQWQNRLFAGCSIKAREDYWLDLYRDIKDIPRLELQTDFKRPEIFTFMGASYDFMLEREDAVRFRPLGARYGGTLYMNILAALETLFYKYTGQTDIIIGSGIAGRPHADLQGIIGMFVNTLGMRNHPEGEKIYQSFLKEVIANSVNAFENQDVQFEALVDKLDPERDPARNPVFDIAMVVQNFRKIGEGLTLQKNSGQIEVLPLIDDNSRYTAFKNPTSKFDMTFFVHEVGEDIYFTIEYYTGIFKEETIKRLVSHFKNIIKVVTETPAIKLKDIEIISREERHQLFYEWNDTAREYPREKTISGLFEDQVVRTPDRIAVVDTEPGALGKEGTRRLAPLPITEAITYHELNQRANQMANYLCLEKHIHRDDSVGILMDRSIDLIIAVMAVLKAGGAYVPMEPSSPGERIKTILNDASVEVVISQKKCIRGINRLQWECESFHTFICIDTMNIHWEDEAEKNELMDEKLWEYVGREAADDITGGGWISSFTGEPFSKEEMDEYGGNVLQKLIPLLHKNMRVLEIGCASGITMYRIAPGVGFYYGTDLSKVIIEKNKERVKKEGYTNIALANLPAHEIHHIDEKYFDLIILNSVIQSFHGHNYLRKVIRKCIDLLTDKGYLFVGDVMDQELKEALIQEMKTFKQANPGYAGKTKIDWSSELFVSRSFFEDLSLDIPGICQVEFSDKIHTIENELTKFRYDVLLHIDKNKIPKDRGQTKRKYQHDLTALQRFSTARPGAEVKSADLAYVIYTSGTTGRPKGVMIRHQSLVNYVLWGIRQYIDIDGDYCYFPLYTSIYFDLTVTSIFVPLLSGNTIVVYDNDQPQLAVLDVFKWGTSAVDIVKATPSHLKLLREEEIDFRNSRVRRFIVGGEAFETALARDIYRCFSQRVEIYNEYGPTEATVGCMIYRFDYESDRQESVPIGKPVDNTTIYILDSYLNPVPLNVAGEIYIGGDALARGYVNDPQLTAERFCLRRPGGRFLKKLPPWTPRKNFLLEGTRGLAPLLYRTGDLARWLPEGKAEFLGRIDHQVKIRGYRVETREIESQLLKHNDIKDAVVISGKDGNGNGVTYLCAYIAAKGADAAWGEKDLNTSELRAFLSRELPDYMIPSYFVQLENIPLTPNGKIDRKGLPKPGLGSSDNYVPPGNEIERKLAATWSEVLDRESSYASIGIHDNFFELGGHSLKATILASRIRKEFNVKFSLSKVFSGPTIKEIGDLIKSAKTDIYGEIQPVEKKEYYPQSSAQKRLYFLQQMDPGNTGYNMPSFLPLGNDIEKSNLESAVKKLITRHESLRTSFVRVNDIPVQRVHDSVEFEIEYYDMKEVEVKVEEERSSLLEGTRGLAPLFIKEFIRPFDLSQAPLLRVGLIELPHTPAALRGHPSREGRERNYILMVDMHHIISDGTSITVLVEDFPALYPGNRLRELRLRYKDFSQWQNRLFESGQVKVQEDYWLDLYSDPGKIPGLFLPADHIRPEVFTFAGDHYSFIIAKDDAVKYKALGIREGGTLYMNILAVLNTLFYRYTNQTDIIIGSGVAGRPHADLQRIMGMFVNTLAIRNYPHGEKTYRSFLKEVIAHSISAFENQDLQFEELVERLTLERDPSRNPLFDICLVVQNFRKASEGMLTPGENGQLKVLPTAGENLAYGDYKNNTSKFDMTFFIHERENDIYVDIEYYTGIFKQETVKRLVSHFKNIIKTVIYDPSIKLKDIQIISEEEKRQILYEFNAAVQSYPKDKTIHQLFEEQVERTPDHIAVVDVLQGVGTRFIASDSPEQNINITYKELNTKSNQWARYLYEAKGAQPGDRVGILLSQSLYRPIAVLGVLKSGAAYVPIDPSLPEERVKYMITDAWINIIISEKRYIKRLNRWQWECDRFGSFLCPDTEDIHGEEELEKNQLMDEELWQHVGETAADEITGGGWVSSYTGKPFSREEMDEYGDNVLTKLAPLLNPGMRVLEIGCASGITMYRIAPEVGLYYGTDLADIIIDRNRKRIREEGHQNIKLAAIAAHEIDQIRDKNFDIVIMNSVVQCFHGHNYLRKVIKKAINLLGQQGYIFIGDIMDQEKKQVLVRELGAFKYGHRGSGCTTKTDFSSELFVSRGFWQDLEAEFETIEAVEFTDKIYTIENELTKFRYDTLIIINKNSLPVKERKRQKQKNQDDLGKLSLFQAEPIYLDQSSRDPAYIIYTSGTTGKPRGVLVEHRSLVNLVYWHNRGFKITGTDRATLYAGFGFDASVWELFPYLIRGACLHIISDSVKLDIEKLKEYYIRNCITISFLPTQLCEHFVREGDNCLLRVLLTGGDKLRTFVKRSYDLYNNYGPTENTVVTTSYPVEKPLDNIPIGKPIANNIVYILDREGLHLQPVGVPGELCIAGDGLARGYLNNPELTAEKFDHDLWDYQDEYHRSYRSYKSYILYKTGDLGRWLPDGNIEFLGRIDRQVKIRGFRIELGEIENRLLNHYLIKEAVVIDREEGNGERYLYACIVPGWTVDSTELKEFLAHTLPDYMIPSYFIPIDKIPLTSSGKVDRKALPLPGHTVGEKYEPPGDKIEKKLAEIWSEVLGGHATIGIHDNFFEIGGHSLKATILTAKIHKELGIKVPLAEIFKHQTIRELSGYIRGVKGCSQEYISIAPVEKKDYYILSSAQKRLYVLHQLDKQGIGYNISVVVLLEGGLDELKFEGSFRQLITRHESLRTSFHLMDEVPVQVVHDEAEFEIQYLATEDTENTEGTRGLAPLFIKEFIRPFNLSQVPLLRVGLIHLDDNRHILMIDMHHIITDGTSLGIIINELMKMNTGEELLPLKLRYKDYSEWQNNDRQEQAVKVQEKYWLKQFEGDIPVLNLPYDYPRPQVQGFEGRMIKFKIGKARASALKTLALRQKTTLYMLLLSIYYVFLAKLSGQEDIVVGTPTAGRKHADLRQVIGMFVNTLALRNFPTGDKAFKEFLEELKQRALEAYENQDYQFESLVEKVVVERDASRNPMFDTMFALQNLDIPELEIRGLKVKPYDHEAWTAVFDLVLEVNEVEAGLLFKFSYSTGLFREETVQRFIRYFKAIASAVLENSQIKLSQIEIIPGEEKKQVLIDFNDTKTDYPRDKTIHELYANQVEKAPDNIALVGPLQEKYRTYMTYTTYISYRELNEKTHGLVCKLREKGVGPDSIVAIMMKRSVEMIISILGILKAGGAYLPIDLEYPQDRIDFMLKDSSARLLIKKSEIRNPKSETNPNDPNSNEQNKRTAVNVLDFEHLNFEFVSNFDIRISDLNASTLAYIIYTSGTTGKPKGVMTSHANVTRVVRNTNYIRLTKMDRVLQLSNYAFDGSVFDIYGALLNSAVLVMIKEEDVLAANRLSEVIKRETITVFFVTTALFNALVDLEIECFKGLRKVLFGGERVSVLHSEKALEYMRKHRIIHVYGPTETTVYATYYYVDEIDNSSGTIPIGKPIANTTVYILDKYLNPVPTGVIGELYIGGDGTARGYLNRPELTSEKFLPVSSGFYRSYMSYRSYIPKKIYRTGDLVRWLPDGNIQFIGRLDHQIKIRGFRVELGEIQSQLLKHPDVKEAVVICRRNDNGDKYICAYFVGANNTVEFREYLSCTLPDYMIPSYFVRLDNIPLTPNGKLDKKALPQPGINTQRDYMAPRNEIEERLLGIWTEILGEGHPRISIGDNFFELGGHSLKATFMSAKIRDEFNIDISLGEIFKTPTIRGIASLIKAVHWAARQKKDINSEREEIIL